MRSFEIPDGSILIDTDSKLSDAVLDAVLAYRDPEGRSVAGIFRYVSLYQIDFARDIDPLEAARITSRGLALGLIQHCLAAPPGKSGWTPSGQLGAAQGVTAARHANLVGYPTDAHLGFDDEDVEGGDIETHIAQWVEKVAPWPPLLYTGFAPGLSPEGLWLLPTIHLYWGAAGNWGPAVCGVACRQRYPSITIGGVSFDWNLASADAKGRRIRMAA